MIPFGLLSLAVSAGAIAFFSPCSYALLPAYVGFFMAQQAEPSIGSGKNNVATAITERRTISRALAVGIFSSLGFTTVLAAAWIVSATAGNIFGTFLPQISLWVGIILTTTGAFFLIKSGSFTVRLPKFMQSARAGYLGAFLFGIAYVIGAIGCTLPVFLVLLAQAALLGPVQSALVFTTFAATMAGLLIVISLLLGLAKKALYMKLRAVLPWIHRVGAALLLVAGLYLVVQELKI